MKLSIKSSIEKKLILFSLLFSLLIFCFSSVNAGFNRSTTINPSNSTLYNSTAKYDFNVTWNASNTSVSSESLVFLEFNSTNPVNQTLLNTTLFNNSGLVAFWRFDDSTNDTRDASGNNNNGTQVMGLANPYWTDLSKFDLAIMFNGVNNSVNVSNSQTLNMTGTGGRMNMTMCAWVNMSATGASMSIIAKNGAYELYSSDSGKLGVNITLPNGTVQNLATGAISLNAWNFVCGRTNGTHISAFVNGAEDTTYVATNGSINGSITNLYIGSFSHYSKFLNGTIDEVRIWNRSLESSEIKRLLNYTTHQYNYTFNDLPAGNYTWKQYMTLTNGTSESTPSYGYEIKKQYRILNITNNTAGWEINTSGLVGYYRFDEATGNKTYDKSGYSHTGTMTNGTNSTFGPTWNTSGRMGYCVQFDGVDDRITITNTTLVQTFCLWEKNTTETQFTFKCWNSTEFFQNGVRIEASNNPKINLSSTITIGWNSTTGNMSGCIDEVTLWNRTLNPNEIMMLYNSFVNYRTNITVTSTEKQNGDVGYGKTLWLNDTKNMTSFDGSSNIYNQSLYFWCVNSSSSQNYTGAEICIPYQVNDYVGYAWNSTIGNATSGGNSMLINITLYVSRDLTPLANVTTYLDDFSNITNTCRLTKLNDSALNDSWECYIPFNGSSIGVFGNVTFQLIAKGINTNTTTIPSFEYQSYPLKTGWNLITLFENLTMSQIASAVPNVSYVSVYNNLYKNYTTYAVGLSTNANLYVNATNATYVYVSGNMTLLRQYYNITTWNNVTLYDNATGLSSPSGWNQMGMVSNHTLNQTLYNNTMLIWCNNGTGGSSWTNANITYISYYNASLGKMCSGKRGMKTTSCYPEFNVTDVNVKRGEAIWILVDTNITYQRS